MKTIQIQGQTIELPFTEAEYRKLLRKWLYKFIKREEVTVDHPDQLPELVNAALSVGLHLAEKEKQERINELEFWNKALRDAVSTVIDGYHLDGMENMGVRDHVFYKECCKAMKAQAYPMPGDSSL